VPIHAKIQAPSKLRCRWQKDRNCSGEPQSIRRRIFGFSGPRSSFYAAEGMPNDQIAASLDTRSEVVSLWGKRFFADRLAGLEEHARSGRPRTFPPPDLVVQIKALACDLPAKHGQPLSRWSTGDLVRHVRESGSVASVSGSMLWRWLHQDALWPWYRRSWILPRDPDFAAKATGCWILRALMPRPGTETR
jgi:transposase